MKIRYRILLLLALPIACQLLTAGWLVSNFARVDRDAEREVQAKRVVTVVDEINRYIARQLVEIADASLITRKEVASKAETELESKTKELIQLVRSDDPALKIAQHYAQLSHRVVENWRDLAQALRPGQESLFFSHFLNRVEYTESMKVLFDELIEDSDKLLNEYGPVAREFQPSAFARRDASRKMILFLIAGNIVVVLITAVLINQSALARLQVVIGNIRRFAKGDRNLQELAGADELAELDKAFRDMSQEKQRLQEIRDSMRAMVSHDLRSPLTAINNRLDLMLEKYGPSLDPEVLLQLTRMYSESQRLIRLASTLLEVEKIEEGQITLNTQAVSASQLIAASIEAVDALADRKSITINQTGGEEVTLLCDEDRTVQVLVNLLVNAIKFSPKQSSIAVLASYAGERHVRIEVHDQGIGVPKETAHTLFSKFYQLEQPLETKKEGSGLGLYICKLLVEIQRGEIGFRALDGGGSCFWFELPNS